jgi:hypothetical protein
LVFDTKVLQSNLKILGNAVFQISVVSDQPQALIAVRLCDVWPDGESTLITRGILNLSQRNRKSNPESAIPEDQYQVEILLNHVGYVVPTGHRLRLSVSTSYWPSPKNTRIKLASDSSLLKLPIRSADAVDGKLTEFGSMQLGKPVANTTLREVDQKRLIYKDSDSGLNVMEIVADNGKKGFDDRGIEMGSTSLSRFSISDTDPLSAKAEYEWIWEYSREDWQTKTRTNTVITSDLKYFYLKAESIAWEGEVEIFRKQWDQKYLRNHF